jgi:hypothetical protein
MDQCGGYDFKCNSYCRVRLVTDAGFFEDILFLVPQTLSIVLLAYVCNLLTVKNGESCRGGVHKLSQ